MEQEDMKNMWDKAVAFHGHVCGGLTIGYKAAIYAMQLLNSSFSEDENIVCIAENDACGVDAIQAVLGCSIGKGNLILHVVGKQAFSFYNRETGKSFRLVLKQQPTGMSKDEMQQYYWEKEPSELFDVKKAKSLLPKKAQIFESFICENCKETAGVKWLRKVDDKCVCIDCVETAGGLK